MSLSRKSVLITGCSEGGIGEGLAKVFHEKGYHVFATLRNPSIISQDLSSLPNVTVLTLDVLLADSIAAAVDSVTKATGGSLDVLVNNSGASLIMPALDTNIEEAKKLYDLNVWAPMAMLQAFVPLLIKAKGCVVNNTSANGYVPMPLMSIYNGSKAALATTSQTWRIELEPLGIRVFTVITTGVKTKMFEKKQANRSLIPENSYYAGLQSLLDRTNGGSLQDGAISPRQYALRVVRGVENSKGGLIWAGTNASVNQWVLWLSPPWLIDMVIEGLVPFRTEMQKVQKAKKA